MPPAFPLAVDSANLGASLAAVVAVGTAAQWFADRVRVPSIIVLLGAGVMVGPGVVGLVDPDEMLGDLLFPAVSLAVGILLFEGGLHLRFRDLVRQTALPVVRLVTLGAAVTWLVGGLAASAIVGLEARNAALLGAVLIVSGPTVMVPLLRFARIREPVNSALRWEGIVIDPIGATIAVVVMRAVLEGGGAGTPVRAVVATSGAGIAAGLVGAALLTLVLGRHWVPDDLHNAVTLAAVLGAFSLADLAQPEAGLFAATVMGVTMANQRWVPIGHIQEFEHDLGTLVLAGLFVVLGARIELGALADWAPEALALLACLVLVARPVAVWVCTVRSGLTVRERGYLACMAPRGIVAASVSAVFGIELANAGRPVEALAPVTFIVIVGTVVIYGVAARPAARWMRVARPEPRGVVLIGGPPWAIELGSELAAQEVPVLVVTKDDAEAQAAAARGLFTYTRRLDAEDLQLALDTVGARLAVAASWAQELNAYGVTRAIAALGRANVYYLPHHEDHDRGEADAMSRRPFGRRLTQADMAETLEAGGRIVTVVTGQAHDHGQMAGAVRLMTVSAAGVPAIAVDEATGRPSDAGVAHIYLVPPATAGGGAELRDRPAAIHGNSAANGGRPSRRARVRARLRPVV